MTVLNQLITVYAAYPAVSPLLREVVIIKTQPHSRCHRIEH